MGGMALRAAGAFLIMVTALGALGTGRDTMLWAVGCAGEAVHCTEAAIGFDATCEPATCTGAEEDPEQVARW